ncbi:YggS family pyridoxal phosphate-dependent enzyme [Luteithermobacter gelatinilyticus]|uniref:YggS family pyridoxal phosphate-dependent enzyme n=1 Tax=Luteithermobacter gelatinilyticus TaxID=2582913 RepID=UPI0011075262
MVSLYSRIFTLTTALETVLEKIAAAEKAAGRPPSSVRLVAVSKTHDADVITPVLQAGQRRFGENRVQEAAAKWPALKDRFPDTELHLIGPLQSNKARQAVRLFDVIETLDRPKLARTLARLFEEEGIRRDLFIQINTGEEAQKAGIAPREADDFIAFCKEELNLPVVGLMCIPPADEDPAPHFALLKKIAARHGLKELSMGMSNDYETAIALGATHVRLGTAIFGQRFRVNCE